MLITPLFISCCFHLTHRQGREPFSIPPLQRLMEQRSLELEQCNMLLLIVVVSEYVTINSSG